MSSKKKQYFSNSSKKKLGYKLEAGTRGFLCTCNGMEKLCVRESYNILNEYAEKLCNEEKNNTEYTDDAVDIGDQFVNEIEAIKQNNAQPYKFNVMHSGVPNCIFIKTEIDDPVSLVHSIMTDLKTLQQRKTRYLIRIVPVEVTCYASMENIEKTADSLFDKYFANTTPTTFSIVFNRRYNTGIDRDSVITKLAEMVAKRNEDHKVDLKHSKLTVVVEILKAVCCISVLPDYFQLCKYNLHSIVPEETVDTNAVGDPANESTDCN